jgi:hypothetical protein
MAYRRLGRNFQKLGVCHPILCPSTIGLYLVKPIDMDKSFQPSPQLTSYMDKIRKFEKDMLQKCQHVIQLGYEHLKYGNTGGVA